MADRAPRTHIVIIDGTLSRLDPGRESHAGQLFKLLTDRGLRRDQSVTYDPGIQGTGWRKWVAAASGMTINFSIEAGYSALASRYEAGDRIMLFGYSRGAYAARSLAGFIGRVGLLRKRHAMQRRVHRAFRYYEQRSFSQAAQLFSHRYCHAHVPIDFIGVWDTVRALGLPYPLVSRLAPMATEFHDHHLGDHVKAAAQALALDETRTAYAALLWERLPDWKGDLDQVWFAGAHMDVGGQLGRYPPARPLGHLPFRWLVHRAAAHGLDLPPGWEEAYKADPTAPAHGDRRGRAKYFLLRAPRLAGHCQSESLHPSVTTRKMALPRYRPKARWVGESSGEQEPDDQAVLRPSKR